MLSEIEELRAAIASQAPRQALSDAEIDAIYVDYTGTPSDRNSMKVARAIEAASGPNAALVAALQSCCDILCDLDMESSNAYNSARAALAAVGVEP